MKKNIYLRESELVRIIRNILNEEKIPKSWEINPLKLRINMGTKFDKNAKINKPNVRQLQKKIANYENCLSILGNNPFDGQFGRKTQTALNQILKSGKCVLTSDTVKPKPVGSLSTSTGSVDGKIGDKVGNKVSDIVPNDCIAVDNETCKKISGKSQVTIGSSGTLTQCAKYTRIKLQKYDSSFWTGNAWHALKNTQDGGASLIYNMFGGGLNIDGLQQWIKENKYNDQICKKFIEMDADKYNVDKQVDNGKLAEEIFKIFPGGSGVNGGDLKLGDIVGVFWAPSTNKGKAFCESAKLDKDGNIIDKKTTINTHMGFVGAIKDGTPVIFHNVHGNFYATPINQLMSKTTYGGMIVWVTRNSDIAHAIGVEKGTEEKTWLEKTTDYFSSDRFRFKTDPGKI